MEKHLKTLRSAGRGLGLGDVLFQIQNSEAQTIACAVEQPNIFKDVREFILRGSDLGITVSGEEIKEYEKLKIISQLTPIKEKIRFFENKYGCSLEDFERSLKEKEESFEEWDDYIEWKAYVESLKI